MADLFETARNRWQRLIGRLRQSEGLVALLAVAVVLVLVLGLGWARWWVPDESGAGSEPERAQLVEGTVRPEERSAHAGRQGTIHARLGRCEEVYSAQVMPRQAVRPAMRQWEMHIGAMNKLVTGAITLAQVRAFWNQTREGVTRNLAQFEDAQHVFDLRTARCPKPVPRSPEQLRGCAAVVAARQRELNRAAVALDTWRTHVRHLEMLRHGELSPEDATRMWLQSWRKGSHQVEAYRAAARGAQRARLVQTWLNSPADLQPPPPCQA